MKNKNRPLAHTRLFLTGLLLLLCLPAQADLDAALRNMSNPDNPLMLLRTSRGDLYLELYREAAPRNVANFIALAEGTATLVDPLSGQAVTQPYYDGLRFDRVIANTLIQTGTTPEDTRPQPENTLPDEINASQLGLDMIPVLDASNRPHPWLNIGDKADLERELLVPLYRRLRIDNPDTLANREYEVLEALQGMTLQQAYQNQGFRFSGTLPSVRPVRGSVVMNNTGPDSNGPGFFITLVDTPWLSGRHTVIGQVVDGLPIAGSIAQAAQNSSNPTFASTRIVQIRQVQTGSGGLAQAQRQTQPDSFSSRSFTQQAQARSTRP